MEKAILDVLKLRKARNVIGRSIPHGRCGIAFSGGKDSTVLLNLVRKVDENIACVFLDHGRHFPETYEFVKSIPNMQTVSKTGWEPDPVSCCAQVKIELIKIAVRELELDVLFVGIRRDEHPARNVKGYEEAFSDHVRVYPILDWTEEDVWKYLKSRDIPTNQLYEKGYRSVGCTNCSAAGGDSERTGRGSKELVMKRLRQLGYF